MHYHIIIVILYKMQQFSRKKIENTKQKICENALQYLAGTEKHPADCTQWQVLIK